MLKQICFILCVTCTILSCSNSNSGDPLVDHQNNSVQHVVSAADPSSAPCYGEEFSTEHKTQYPNSQISEMFAKFEKVPDQYAESGFSDVLTIQAKMRDDPKLYQTKMVCFTYKGQTYCPIECDGGSVVVASMDENHLVINNNGFMISRSCDPDHQTVPDKFVSAQPGDDVFDLPVARVCPSAN